MEGAVGSSSGEVGVHHAGEAREGDTTSRKRGRESSSPPAVDGMATIIFADCSSSLGTHRKYEYGIRNWHEEAA